MKTIHTILICFLLALNAIPCAAQIYEQDGQPVVTSKETGLISVSSKGGDVRDVLFDLFDQSKKSFVLEPSVRFTLYLSLRDVEFEEALELICATAGLEASQDNGVYFVNRKKANLPAAVPTPKIVRKLGEKDMEQPVTVKLMMTDFRTLLGEMSRQTNVMIEIDENVPRVKVDAVFHATPLRQALSVLVKAANLEFVLTDHYTVRVRKAQASVSSHS